MWRWCENMEFILFVGISVITSAVVTKILATHYFKIVDGYVKSVVNDAKKIMVENFSHQGRL